jgi:AcrR family transcriptional regulator
VADIQTACGLTAGSGALYKHFSSKEELLREVLRRHVAGIAKDRREAVANPPDGLSAALRFGAEMVWRSMERDRMVIRITMRDLDPFPDLVDELWDSTLRNVYQQFALLLRHENELGRIDIADPEATAAVLVASLTYLPILDGLIGRTPGDVDRDRFLDAWVESAHRTLARTEQGAAIRASSPRH